MMAAKLVKAFRQWIPFGSCIVLATLFTGVVMQQYLRHTANDPQIQLAEDAAASLASGARPVDVVGEPVDASRSLAPFVNVYDANGKPIAGSGKIDDVLPTPPLGVFDAAKSGRTTVTWQPRADIRIAVVIEPVKGGSAGYVLAGRSLREVEAQVVLLMKAVVAGCALSSGALFILILILS